jgi:hypothetical protein
LVRTFRQFEALSKAEGLRLRFNFQAVAERLRVWSKPSGSSERSPKPKGFGYVSISGGSRTPSRLVRTFRQFGALSKAEGLRLRFFNAQDHRVTFGKQLSLPSCH